MKPRTILFSLLLVALTATSALAQNQGGRRFGGRGGGVARLLFRSDVQTDLQLTADQKTKLDALRTSMRGQRGGAGGGTPPTADEMKARRDEQQKQVAAILTPEQVKRLGEIAIQVAGDQAVLEPDVQKQLDLTADQKAKIKDLQDKQREANQSIRDKVQSGEIQRDASRDLMQKNNQAMSDEIHKLLTEAQLAKLKTLGGTPFKADETTNRG